LDTLERETQSISGKPDCGISPAIMHSAGSWPISQVVWLQLVGVPAAGKCAIRCCWGSARVVGAFSDFGVRTRKTGAFQTKCI